MQKLEICLCVDKYITFILLYKWNASLCGNLAQVMAHDSVICATFNLSDWLCEFRYSVFCLVNYLCLSGVNCLECSAVTLFHYPGTRKLSYLLTSRDTFCRFQSNLTQSILGWRAFKIDIENGQIPSVEKKYFKTPFRKSMVF